MPRIELSFQDTFPAGPTGPLRARQAENHRSVRNTCHGAGLIVDGPISSKDFIRQFPKPSICLSKSGVSASGVLSRP